ncbi:MAG: ABC transporter permease [Tissierellia bacterium]|nr:ABC transporter permease [Tissierellia bacterium]
MKNLGNVLSFEIKSFFRKKPYIITTVILIIIAFLITSIPTISNLISSGKNKDESDNVKADRYGYYTENQEIQKYISNSEISSEIQIFDSKDNLIKAVKEEKIKKGFIIISDTQLESYVIDRGFDNHIDEAMSDIITKYNRDKILVSEGIDPSLVDKANDSQISINTEVIGKDSKSSLGMVYIAMMGFYFLIIMYGTIVATSVAREKSDRTMELLITSTSPKSLIVGKVLAASIVGILQLILISLSTLIGIYLNRASYPEGIFDLIGFKLTADGVAVLIVFSLLGLLMYLFLFAALGALVSKVEDVNTSVSPVMFIFVAVYLITNFTITMPDKSIAKIASIVPLSSPMTMVARYSLVSVSIPELALSLALLLVTTIIIAMIAIKIYRLGTLNYGNRLSFFKAIKMSLKRK